MRTLSHNNNDRYIALGFFLLELMIVVRNVMTGYVFFYWYCDFAPLLFALFFFFHRIQDAKGLMYIGLLGQVTYNISFLSILFFGHPFLGFDIPLASHPLESIVTVIMHLSSFAVFMVTRKIPPKLHALIASGVMITGIYFLVVLTTSPNINTNYNFNYIYYSDLVTWVPTLAPYYTSFWIPIAFFGMVIPAYFIDRALYFLHQLPQTSHRHIFHVRHA